MKKSFIILLMLFMAIAIPNNTLAQSKRVNDAFRAYEKGINAYNNGNYIESLPDLKVAAQSGIAPAYEPIISLYANGDYDGSEIGNYKEAMFYLNIARDAYVAGDYANTDLAILIMQYYMPLCFLTGNYLEVINICDERFYAVAYEMIQVSCSYLAIGNYAKANEWISKAINMAQNANEETSIHTANAVLAKIEFDKKNYAQAIKLSASSASKGHIPLAAYVLGASLIRTNDRVEIGKEWVKLAAEYNYSGIYEINCFESEIKQFWNSIK